MPVVEQVPVGLVVVAAAVEHIPCQVVAEKPVEPLVGPVVELVSVKLEDGGPSGRDYIDT